MAAKVVDSSVLAAIVFGEPEAARAEALVEDAELFAPGLVLFELANIAWKKSKRHPDRATEIAAGLRLALQLDVRTVEVAHEEVLEVALETGLTAYDASYVWLARSLSVPLATFDSKVSKAM